jgi:uncharacterized protein YbaR (Trm112 family)
MKKKILSMLCCPITHSPLSKITEKKLIALNSAIDEGLIIDRDQNIIKINISDALVNEEGIICTLLKKEFPCFLKIDQFLLNN